VQGRITAITPSSAAFGPTHPVAPDSLKSASDFVSNAFCVYILTLIHLHYQFKIIYLDSPHPQVNYRTESACLKPSMDIVTFDFGIAMRIHLEKAINPLLWNIKSP